MTNLDSLGKSFLFAVALAAFTVSSATAQAVDPATDPNIDVQVRAFLKKLFRFSASKFHALPSGLPFGCIKNPKRFRIRR